MHYCSGKTKAILIVPGFLQNFGTAVFQEISESFLPDHDVLTLNLRGHGKSGGSFTLTAKETLDVDAALRFLKTAYSRIGLIGFSFGAAVAILSAAKNDAVNSLIAVSAYSALSKVDYHFWKKEAVQNLFFNFSPKGKGLGVRIGDPFLKKARPIDQITHVKAPVFFLHGDRDWILRLQHSIRLYEKAPGKKRVEIIQGGLHAEKMFTQDPLRFRELTMGWFGETL
jgi:pimeloyl-ACP methyl ester carboxylesterase